MKRKRLQVSNQFSILIFKILFSYFLCLGWRKLEPIASKHTLSKGKRSHCHCGFKLVGYLLSDRRGEDRLLDKNIPSKEFVCITFMLPPSTYDLLLHCIGQGTKSRSQSVRLYKFWSRFRSLNKQMTRYFVTKIYLKHLNYLKNET